MKSSNSQSIFFVVDVYQQDQQKPRVAGGASTYVDEATFMSAVQSM